jgi:squalene monooxygenase
MWKQHYDVLIVGAGIAGSAMAYALSTLPSTGRPLRICILERSLAEPDRIVGELLQPGGVEALEKLGMADCLAGIDATPVRGYAVAKAGETVHIPYPGGREGRSFHHGRFIVKLREKVLGEAEKGSVDVVEATVQELLECDLTGRVLGVKATRKAKAEAPVANGHANGDANGHANGHANGDANGHANGHANGAANGDAQQDSTPTQESFFADLTIIADGCFSNFRTSVLPPDSRKPSTRSHFVGAVLKDAPLPIPNCGTVCLVKGSGPVLLYQIAEKAEETRILIDIKAPLPSDLKVGPLILVLPDFTRLGSDLRTRRASSPPTSSPNSHPHCSPRSPPRSRRTGSGACPTRSSRRTRRPARAPRRASSSSATRGTCATRSRAAG